jgi:hypothetical protein
MKRRIRLFEDFAKSKGPKYTEDEIEQILSNFDGSKFFELDLEKTNLVFEYPSQLKEVESFRNGEEGSLEYYIDNVVFEIAIEDFLQELESKFISLGKDVVDDPDNILGDMKSVGFDDKVNSASWEEISRAIRKNMKKITGPSYARIDSPELDIVFESEQRGFQFLVRLYIDSYKGDINFDSQEFSDEILTDLFFVK